MSKSSLWGVVGLLVGAIVGAGVVRLIDMRQAADEATSSSKQAAPNGGSGQEADPVVAALDTEAFFERIAGGKANVTGYSESGLGLPHYFIGEALWNADPIDEDTLRVRMDAAFKAPILAAGARSLSDKVSAGVIQNGSHKLYTFVCFYEAKIGGRLQNRQATAWVTVPVQGQQYSACFRFGK